MSSYEQAMVLLAACGVRTAIVGLYMAHQVDRLEQERKERDRARHPIGPGPSK